MESITSPILSWKTSAAVLSANVLSRLITIRYLPLKSYASEAAGWTARVVRSNMITAFENINLWHERDISHSSAERIIFPDSLVLVDFMIARFTNVLENLVVNEDNMLKNTNLYGGIVFSQKVLLKLVEKGYSREDAYRIVQKHALNALNSGDFKQGIESEEILSEEEVLQCFDKEEYLKNIELVYTRF